MGTCSMIDDTNFRVFYIYSSQKEMHHGKNLWFLAQPRISGFFSETTHFSKKMASGLPWRVTQLQQLCSCDKVTMQMVNNLQINMKAYLGLINRLLSVYLSQPSYCGVCEHLPCSTCGNVYYHIAFLFDFSIYMYIKTTVYVHFPTLFEELTVLKIIPDCLNSVQAHILFFSRG